MMVSNLQIPETGIHAMARTPKERTRQRLVGSHPSARQPLPGTKEIRQGLERMNWAVQVRDTLGEKRRE